MYINFFKRLIDIIISLVALLLLSPVFFLITISLFFANKGTPFFYQERPGKDEKVFKIVKFKSMNDKKDKKGNLLPDIQRLTKVGAIVRKTSLDEIPQLINVIKGDMSLIGPRPLLVKYLPYYSERERLRHTVRPGITGLAQVIGRNNLMWDERLEIDVQYAENVTFIGDLKIFLKTIINVLKHKDNIVVSSEFVPDFDDYRKRINNDSKIKG
ncbi:MAG: sugar transferase [Moheibacter sp.]